MPGSRTSVKTTSGRSAVQQLERLLRVAGDLHLVARLHQVRPDGARERALVVDDENGAGCSCVPGAGGGRRHGKADAHRRAPPRAADLERATVLLHEPLARWRGPARCPPVES